MARFLLGLVAPIAVVMAAVGASAHAFLDQASPPVGGAVTSAPSEIRLVFSEGVEPRFSGIAISTADGRPVSVGQARDDPADDRKLVLALPPLPPGRYRVRWHVVSVDTHRTQGEYTFEVTR
jgi:methionine-rich copper-binding protein CopC